MNLILFSVFAVPDYQFISLSFYTHTIVWDVVTGKANVSVYVNVTSHWTSLAVLKGFIGELVMGSTYGLVYSYPNVIPVVVGLSVVLAFMCTYTHHTHKCHHTHIYECTYAHKGMHACTYTCTCMSALIDSVYIEIRILYCVNGYVSTFHCLPIAHPKELCVFLSLCSYI